MRTHTGEKTYTFTQCGEAYSNKGNIHKHMKTYIGKKPCQCRQYEKVFSYKFDLDSHMRIHTVNVSTVRKYFDIKYSWQSYDSS